MEELKFKGTPGPWEVADIDDGWKDCVSARAARGNVIAVAHNEDRATAEADARLIAAAPELLEVINELLEYVDYMGSVFFSSVEDEEQFYKIVDKAHKVVYKALGE